MEVVPLRRGATQPGQRGLLLGGLHAFGHDPYPEVAGQVDGRLDDRGDLRRVHHPPDEAPVDLDLVDVYPGQEGQRRVPGAEVVDGQPYPQLTQGKQDVVDDRQFAHHHGFGDLQDQPVGRYPVLGQQVGELPGQVGVEQAARREVDRDRYRHVVRRPFGGQPERLIDDVPGERADQVAVLQYRDELVRQQLTAPRMLPADQRLDAGRRAGREVERGLVGQHELAAAAQRLAQLGEQGQPVGAAVVAGTVVPADHAAAALGPVHRDVPAAQQLGHVHAAGRRDHHADRALRRQGYPGHRERRADQVDELAGPVQRPGQPGQFLVGGGRPVQRGDEQPELVAGQPGDQLVPAGVPTHPRGDRAQQEVASRVPERVVDLAEVVDVEQQQGDGGLPVQYPQRAVALGQQRVPVGQPGQPVVRRRVQAAGGQCLQLAVRRRVVQRRGQGVGERGQLHLLARTQLYRFREVHPQLTDLGTAHLQRPGLGERADRRARRGSGHDGRLAAAAVAPQRVRAQYPHLDRRGRE